jgi:adenylate cyclase class 2
MSIEIEAKFLNINRNVMREKLATARYICTVPDRMMTRVTLHEPHENRNKSQWWRVRDEGTGRITMTWKCTDANTVDGTREVEIEVSHFETAVRMLETTGLQVIARQETRRETWINGNIEVVIDEWPGINPFIEIESSDVTAVQNAAQELGFDMNDAVFGAVAQVYERELGHTPDVVNNWPLITFENPPKKAA